MSSIKYQMSAFLTTTTILVHDGLHALFYTFLLNCDLTSTTQAWARLKALIFAATV